MDYAQQNKMTPDDLLELDGGVKMLWTEIDRNNYTNPYHPIPPSYTLYTGLSLGDTFKLFLGILSLHFIILLILKLSTENWKRDGFRGWFNIMISSLENMNISRPTQDWDQKQTDDGNQVHSTIDYYKKKFRYVRNELIISYVLNWIFSFVLLIPLWYSGELFDGL